MKTNFLDGFLVLLCPDCVFEKCNKQQRFFNALISVFFSNLFFSSLCIYSFFKNNLPFLKIKINMILLLILNLYFIIIICSAILSYFLDRFYPSALKIKGLSMDSNLSKHFLCRIYVLPLWFLLLYIYLIMVSNNNDINIIGYIFIIIMLLRILDVEARLIKVVYNIKLAQAYLIISVEAWLISIGVGIGWIISTHFSFILSLIFSSK
ncbi:MAG: hypothetical protein DRP78_00530 [Candidatus Omnitrophota bacterium]|nr:MAG: hypothetical protein DRP78_00530 [Candidatus Omnitrophota bacterium]